MIRGIERRKIFRNHKDREDFFILMKEEIADHTRQFILNGVLKKS